MKPRLTGILFYVALLCALTFAAILLQRLDLRLPLAQGKPTLSAASLRLLRRLDQPLHIDSYAPGNARLRQRIAELIAPYQRASHWVRFQFIDPDLEPRRARAAGIRAHGELVLEYAGRVAHLVNLDETSISRAIARLQQAHPRWLVSLSGHGERRFHGRGNLDLGRIGGRLRRLGYQLVELDAGQIDALPDNTDVLILADPDKPYDPHTQALVLGHLARGGDLLLLDDRQTSPGTLDFVLRQLGMQAIPGWVYDPEPPMELPAVTLLAATPDKRHPATRKLELPLLLAEAHAYRVKPRGAWRAQALLRPNPAAWSETQAPGKGRPSFDLLEGDTPHPPALAWSLQRRHNGRPQRVILVGDADFAADRFLGNGDNAAFLIDAIGWLTHAAALGGDFGPRNEPLQLDENHRLIIGFGFLFALPLLLSITGLGIHWHRRRQ